jgi:hypothetical protein
LATLRVNVEYLPGAEAHWLGEYNMQYFSGEMKWNGGAPGRIGQVDPIPRIRRMSEVNVIDRSNADNHTKLVTMTIHNCFIQFSSLEE